MICSKTYKATPSRSGFTRRTYSSIRCSRQTQRTQLESIENRSFNEQHERYLRRGCHTISKECDLIGQSSASQSNEQRDVSGIDSRHFMRGPTQLRDSRRKTAEKWQTRKHSLVNDRNCVEEVRRSQKVKFSLPISNRLFLRNLRNAENKKSHQISATKHFECTRTHLLSFSPSSITGPKSKNCNAESNFDTLYHSDSSYPINSFIKSEKSHLKSAGLHEIHANTSAQNQIPLNEKVS
uniref:Uncharacterized protein n=1 Tax=Elaeophora elaphi TaxID=1147741 RepID=A0A0R3RZW5_9BILA